MTAGQQLRAQYRADITVGARKEYAHTAFLLDRCRKTRRDPRSAGTHEVDACQIGAPEHRTSIKTPSWPGLSRPSTTYFGRFQKKDVDARPSGRLRPSSTGYGRA